MKSIKKIFAGLLMATAAFGFFGCSEQEDSDLETVITADGNNDSSSRKVTMTASSEGSEGNDVYIVYTLDGSEPTLDFNKTAWTEANSPKLTKSNIRQYVDYGPAELYESSITISESTIIKAKAFYLVTTDARPFHYGPLATKEVKVKATTTTTDSDNNKSGTLTFKLTATGNTFSTHYYDTSEKTFAYNGNQHCYYQFQFSTKANGSGNWYLYIRQLGNANTIKSENGSSNFVAKGTFTGSCFNKTEVTSGNITMKYLKADGTAGGDFGSVSVTEGNNSSFDLTVTTNITDAIAANDAK